MSLFAYFNWHGNIIISTAVNRIFYGCIPSKKTFSVTLTMLNSFSEIKVLLNGIAKGNASAVLCILYDRKRLRHMYPETTTVLINKS